jgi:hypothetical protein
MTYFQAIANEFQTIANELREAIDRVRELHVPKEYENTCKTCDKTDMGVTVPYPCPTIQALDTKDE